MLDQADIDAQQELLQIHRRNLRHLLRQATQRGGESFAPIEVMNGIREARAAIRAIKTALRDAGVRVEDLPNDEPPAMPGDEAPAAGLAPVPNTRRNVETAGGDYAEGNVDKRQGVFVSGGTIMGPVVGTNSGTVTAYYGGAPGTSRPAPVTLEQALVRVQNAAQQAQECGDDDLADDLQSAVLPLQAAIKAQAEGKVERRTAKLAEARGAMRRLAGDNLPLQPLAAMLDAVE